MICSLHAFCLPFAVQVCRSMALYTSPSPVLLFLITILKCIFAVPFLFFYPWLSQSAFLTANISLPSNRLKLVYSRGDNSSWHVTWEHAPNTEVVKLWPAVCLLPHLLPHLKKKKKQKNMHKYRCRCTYVSVHIRQIKTRSDVHPPLCVFTTSAVQIFD